MLGQNTNNKVTVNGANVNEKEMIVMMDNTTTQALVSEVLTKEEVMSLLNETLTHNGNINDYLSILKAEYTAWSGEVYNGYIVCHHTRTVTPETINDFMPTYVEHNDYYFMEVTLEEVVNPMGTSHLWEPTFHKLMPVMPASNPVLPNRVDAKAFTQYIVSCCKDTWEYIKVPYSKKEIEADKKKDYWWYSNHTTRVCPLTYNDIYCHWSTPITEEEKKALDKQKKDAEDAIIARFSTGELPPAEDDAWYSVLSSGYGTAGYDFECKVLKILKNRGFNVYIDGERDSFGWVTRGIFVNGKTMCIY